MIPYKNIGDHLTTNEFNGIISLLRDNINFMENIQINTSTVTGEYGNYVFNFNEATVLDNGILITNETLSTVGTVQLTNPAFPHSHYFLDMKVYSSEDVGVSGMDHSDVIVTELTIPLEIDTEVNIPFQTLDMNNIVSFDAIVRVNHKDLVIKNQDILELSVNKEKYGYKEPILLTATYTDDVGVGIEGKTIVFKSNGDYVDSAVTDENGVASISCEYDTGGEYTFQADCDIVLSNECDVEVIVSSLEIKTTSNFNNGYSNPEGVLSVAGGNILIDWGDGTTEEYSTPITLLNHIYDTQGTHTVKFKGYITSINDNLNQDMTEAIIPSTVTKLDNGAFKYFKGTSITIPSSVTTIGYRTFYDYYGDTNLTSLNIPSSVTSIGEQAFENCAFPLYLNWTTSDTILPYNYKWNWMGNTTKYMIPYGTTALYTAKGYPSNKLQENVTVDSVTLSASPSSISTSETSTLTALVKDDEDRVLPNQTVTFYDGQTSVGTATTNSNGIATKSFSSNTSGSHTITAKCGNVTSSSVTVTVTVSYTNIEVSANKNILSYADSDKATLYAQLKDANDTDVEQSGVTITFSRCDSHGTVIETLGTADTDATGKATLTNGYTSQGLGDIYVGATDGTLLIQTYAIEDCHKYISSVSSTTTYGIDLPSEFIATFLVKRTSDNSSTCSLHMGVDTSNRIIAGTRTSYGIIGLLVQKNGSWVVQSGSQNISQNTEKQVTYKWQNNTSTVSWDNETVTDSTNQITPSKLLQIEKSTNGTIREIKIKPL